MQQCCCFSFAKNSDRDGTNGTVFRHDKHREEMHELTVQLLIQGLDLPRLLDQADLVAADVVVLGGAIHCDACERDGASGRLLFCQDITKAPVNRATGGILKRQPDQCSARFRISCSWSQALMCHCVYVKVRVDDVQ